jgi:hypothetical protein
LLRQFGNNDNLWELLVSKGYTVLQEIPASEFDNIMKELKGAKK